jgi:hypothetical protein
MKLVVLSSSTSRTLGSFGILRQLISLATVVRLRCYLDLGWKSNVDRSAHVGLAVAHDRLVSAGNCLAGKLPRARIGRTISQHKAPLYAAPNSRRRAR